MIVIPNTLLQEEIQDQQMDKDTEQREKLIQVHDPLKLSHSVLKIPYGIIGFEQILEYSIDLIDGGIIYKITGQPNDLPSFYLINPYLIQPQYTLSIREEDYSLLEQPDFNDILVFAIITLKEQVEDHTCNLLGPILVNNVTGTALQVINDSNSNNWGTKHLLSNGQKISEARLID